MINRRLRNWIGELKLGMESVRIIPAYVDELSKKLIELLVKKKCSIDKSEKIFFFDYKVNVFKQMDIPHESK